MSRTKHTFKRVLIANRGEIAVRIARTLREMEISPVAVFSDADRIAPHVRACDLAFNIGPGPAPESYLKGDVIIDVAKRAKCDAIHPGYGFLSENGDFADAVSESGLVFIGPSGDAMRKMGSKTAAREIMTRAEVPCVPGSNGPVEEEAEALRVAEALGYPIMFKASAGGGGKGMRAVESPSEMSSALRAARSEALNAFGDDTVYLEKLIVEPRHVEIQILSGNDHKTIWLGERECSMQRRHQKIIEESPSVAINGETRQEMGEVACRAAEAVDYVGAGTVEFLLDQNQNFYFLEMNTRLQVEHPVTELCCGLDLVEGQMRVAQGEDLPWRQEEITRTGHAIECRLYAEDPLHDFMPSPGYVDELILPHGPGVRVDCGVAAGFEVPRFYDPMIAKLVVWAEDRARARSRMDRALRETAVKGITTNTIFLRRLLKTDAFVSGDYHTGSVAKALEAGPPAVPPAIVDVAVAAAVVNAFRRDTRSARQGNPGNTARASGWRRSTWRMKGM